MKNKFQLQIGESGQPVISTITDTPAAMREMSRLLTANAKIIIHPHMKPSELTAAYEAKAALALEAGLFYKQNLSRNVRDWDQAPRTMMARWLGLEASTVDAPNRHALEAGDYTDPNNQFGILNGTLVMLRALPLYAYDYPELAAMFTDFSGEPGVYEQESTTHIVNVPAVEKYNAALDANGRPIGFVTASPANTLDVPITLTDYVAVPIVIGQGTVGATQRDLFAEQAPAGIKAIAGYFVNMMTALLTPQNFNAYLHVTNDNPQTVPVAYASYVKSVNDFDVVDFDKMDAIFTQNKVPGTDRGMLMNPAYFAKARNASRLLFAMAGDGVETSQVTESQLPSKISGFKPFKAAYLPALVPFFPFHKAGIVLKSRLPADFTSALKLNPNQIPGSVTTVTDPDTKLSVSLVQRVDLVGNYAEWRPETLLGAGVGDNRGGLCGGLQ